MKRKAESEPGREGSVGERAAMDLKARERRWLAHASRHAGLSQCWFARHRLPTLSFVRRSGHGQDQCPLPPLPALDRRTQPVLVLRKGNLVFSESQHKQMQRARR